MQPLLNTPFVGFEIAAPNAVAALIIVHGLAEHSERYRDIAGELARSGITVFVYDQRGHGGSPGARTHIARFEDFVDDLTLVVTAVRARHPALPLFVWGHSLGAVVTTLLAARTGDSDQGWLRGVITSSHSLAIFTQGTDPTRLLFRIASLIVPRVRIPLGLDGAKISSDEVVQRAYVGDPQIPHTASLRLIVEFATACKQCHLLLPAMVIPWLVIHGADDAIAPALGSQQLFDALGSEDKSLTIYPGLRHEVHNERAPSRAVMLNAMSEWMHQRASRASQQ